MKIFGYTIPQLKKSIASGLGFAVAALTLFIQSGVGAANWIAYGVTALGLCTTALVFVLKNESVEQPPVEL